MKTVPIAKAGMVQESGPNYAAAQDAKARAIAKMTAPVQGQTPPVPVNANNISAEEIGAVKQQSRQSDTNVIEAAQEDSVVDTSQETAAETPKAPEKQPESSQMAILARKERALRAKAQQQDLAFKAREEAIKAKETAIAAKSQEYQSGYISKQRIKDDLLGVMAEEGLSYDELTQQLINQQPENPRVKAQMARLEAANKALEDKILAFEKNSQDQTTASYQAALNQIKTDVKDLVKTDPTYEAIRATRSEQDVVDLIEETFKKDGRVMSVEEASQEVEEYLVDEAYKLSELKKVQKRRQLASTAKAPTQMQTPNTNKQQQPMKTLTNATSSTRQLSAKERAILAFKGELGKG